MIKNETGTMKNQEILFENEMKKLFEKMVNHLEVRSNSKEILSFIKSSNSFNMEFKRDYYSQDYIKNLQHQFDSSLICNSGDISISIIRGVINLTSKKITRKYCCSINIGKFNYKTEYKKSLNPCWNESTTFVLNELSDFKLILSLHMDNEIIGYGSIDLDNININNYNNNQNNSNSNNTSNNDQNQKFSTNGMHW
jgi:hypothetical protein